MLRGIDTVVCSLLEVVVLMGECDKASDAGGS
jgi:hypothetical protein